jgi:hypothetical protein
MLKALFSAAWSGAVITFALLCFSLARFLTVFTIVRVTDMSIVFGVSTWFEDFEASAWGTGMIVLARPSPGCSEET